MKDHLFALINQVDIIRTYFKSSNPHEPFAATKTIYNVPEFAEWSQALLLELQEIHDRTHDKYIWETLVTIKQGFSGWHDEASFAKLSGMLHAIQKNISKYYPAEKLKIMEEHTMPAKSPKIFISHSSKDKEIVSTFVDLLLDMGLNTGHIFCTSVPGCGVLIDNDIYESLKHEFENYQVHVIFMLSSNYYNSPACLNEMGAAWILQTSYTSILLPGFEFKEIDGAVNPRRMAIKLDESEEQLKEKLGQMKQNFLDKFTLPRIPDTRWETKRNEFIAKVQERTI